jgi:hypothetical protein
MDASQQARSPNADAQDQSKRGPRDQLVVQLSASRAIGECAITTEGQAILQRVTPSAHRGRAGGRAHARQLSRRTTGPGHIKEDVPEAFDA